MKKIIFLSIFMFFEKSILLAQKNKLEINLGAYSFPNKQTVQGVVQQGGVTYSRKIDNKWHLFLSTDYVPFSLGLIFKRNDRFFITSRSNIFLQDGKWSEEGVGKVYSRSSGRIGNLGANYEIYKNKNHRLSLDFGVSVITCLDQYLVYFKVQNVGPQQNLIWEKYETKRGWYIGGLAGLRYDYSFWKDRVNVGAYFKARAYKDFPFQLNYGLQLGFSF